LTQVKFKLYFFNKMIKYDFKVKYRMLLLRFSQTVNNENF